MNKLCFAECEQRMIGEIVKVGFRNTARLVVASTLLSLFALIPVQVSLAPEGKAANTACAVGAAAQNSIEVEPSHGKVLYMDTGVSPRIDGAYIGYRVKNTTGATITGWWVSLSNFVGGSVSLAYSRDQYMQLPSITNNEVKTVYFLVKASTATRVAQTHTVKVFNGRPDVAASSQRYICDFSFSKVAETIKAAANKITSITVDDSTPDIGQLITVTARGQTGTIGAGSADVGRILWFSPSAFSNFPTSALRLESVSLKTADNSNFNTGGQNKVWTFSERLLISTTTTPTTGIVASSESTADDLVGKRYYENVYKFRVLSRTASSTSIQPIAQISSGTQIKHTDLSAAGSSLALNLTTVPLNVTVTKSVTSTSNLQTAACGGSTCNVVPYRIRIAVSSGSVTIDEIVDTPASGVTYQAGSVAITSGAISAPVQLTSESNLNPQPYHFVGPFAVTSGTNLDITYSMLVPQGANATYVNQAVAYVGAQVIGASSSSVSIVTVTNNSSGGVSTAVSSTQTIDPEAITFPATSIATTTAVLNGTVDGNGNTPSAQFEWSTNPSLSTYTTVNVSASVSGSDATAFTSDFTGTSGTTYYYRIVAIKSGVRYQGSIVQFTLIEPAGASVATTNVATSILTQSATLNGSIDPNLQNITEVRFRYGTASNLAGASTKILYELNEDGTESAVKVTLTGANPIDVSWLIPAGSLSATTTYYYRIEGDYNDGSAQTASGSILSFKTGTSSQTITFNALTDQTFSASPITVSATTSATGLSVSYSSETTDVCTVNSSTGVVTFIKVGFCAITASQAGNATYAPAEPVTQQFEITAVAPTATTNSASNVAKTTATLNGAITIGGATTTVTFVYSLNSDLSSGTTVTATQSPLNANGNVTFGLTGLSANTQYYFKVVAQNSHSTVSGSTLNFTTQSLTALTITASNQSKSYLAADPTFAFTSSGLVNPDAISSVTYTFSKDGTDGFAAYGPSTSVPTEVGVYTITPSAAVFSTGSATDYSITYAVGTYTISRINQAALSLSGASVSQSSTTTLNATGGSGTGAVSYVVTSGTCTISTNQLTSQATNETCVVTVTKAQDRNYNQQTTTANFVVNSKLSQTITFADPADRAFNPAAFNHNASASSTLAVTLTSNSLTICTVASTGIANQFSITMLRSGTCSITATQDGNDNYNAAPSVTQEFVISKAARSIVMKNKDDGAGYSSSFDPNGYATWGDAAPTLKSLASEDDSDSKTYSLGTGSTGCSVAANGAVTFTGAGTCVVKVAITGNRYADATSSDASFTIGKKNQLITFTALNNMILDDPDQNLTYSTDAAGLTVSVAVAAGSSSICEIVAGAIRAKAAGSCVIEATQGGNTDFNAASSVQRTFQVSASGSTGGSSAPVAPPPPPGPRIDSISKPQICAIGNDIVIAGNYFDSGKVYFDGAELNVKSLTSTNISVSLPRAAGGARTITITTPNGSASVTVTYVDVPKPKFIPIFIPYMAQGDFISLPVSAANAYAYSTRDRLPSGLVLNPTTGTISGIPTENGIFTFLITATGICGETDQVIELDIDKPTPNAISFRVNLLPNSACMSQSARDSLNLFLDKVKEIAPRNLIPDIYISGGGVGDPTALGAERLDCICETFLDAEVYGNVIDGEFTGSPNRIEIIVYWAKP